MNYKISDQELAEAQKADLSRPQPFFLEQGSMQVDEIKESNGAAKIKSRPNHKLYLQVLEKMGPEQRLAKAFELSDFSRSLFFEGLRIRFPEKTEEEIKGIYLKRIAKCYNRNY
jgi:hypothetical protein